MNFVEIKNGYAYFNAVGETLAEITYSPAGDFVIADHTYVSEELRGQGVGEQLLDHLVAEMDKQGKKIKALCPFVIRKFGQESKYDFINFDKR